MSGLPCTGISFNQINVHSSHITGGTVMTWISFSACKDKNLFLLLVAGIVKFSSRPVSIRYYSFGNSAFFLSSRHTDFPGLMLQNLILWLRLKQQQIFINTMSHVIGVIIWLYAYFRGTIGSLAGLTAEVLLIMLIIFSGCSTVLDQWFISGVLEPKMCCKSVLIRSQTSGKAMQIIQCT